VQALKNGAGCNGRVPVFDGRRRYDLITVDRGVKPFAAEAVSRFSGEARQCDFTVQPIAGFERRDKRMNAAEEQLPRQGRAWLKRIDDDMPPTPIRIEYQGEWGATVITLKEFVKRPELDVADGWSAIDPSSYADKARQLIKAID
jgi:hypothetical protein